MSMYSLDLFRNRQARIEDLGEKEDYQFGFGANYDFEDDHDLNDCNWAKHR